MPLVDYSQIAIPFAVLIFSLTIHEAAHAWSADLLGDQTASTLGRVSFNPVAHLDRVGSVLFPIASFVSGFAVVGWARPVAVDTGQLGPHWRRKATLIAAAGPASNLVIAVVAAGLIHAGAASTRTGFDMLSAQLLFKAVDLNVLLAAMNVLPVPPLDGGNLLGRVLPEHAAAAVRGMRPYGVFVVFALLLTGLLQALLDPIRAFFASVLF